MIIRTFSYNNTNVIKGFAILSIILHNLFHCIDPSSGENEFTFSIVTVNNLISGIIANPLDSINLLFSYFGHYGVQLFIFFSGYGLTISMTKKHLKWAPFMIERLKKLYPLLIVGFLFFFLGNILINREFLNSHELKQLIFYFTFLDTIYPATMLKIIGPWWFFSLIIQLYALFHILYKLISKYQTKALLLIFILSYSIMYFTQYFFQGFLDNIMINFTGHTPEFSLGIWYALNKDKKISNYFVMVAVMVFILSNFYQEFFPLSFISICFILISLFNVLLKREKQNIIIRMFSFYGSISMVLFAIHSIYRMPFISLAHNYNSPYLTILLAIIFVILITILSIPAKDIYIFIVSKINNLHAKIASKKNSKPFMF